MANDFFSKQAEFYAAYRPTYPPELYDFIFKYVKNKKTAWDCATGSGQVAAYLADFFEKVHASDISRKQLNHAVKKPNIEYHCVPAEDTDFPPNTFDLVTVAQAIHWFDIEQFYEEVCRTAKPGAIVAIIGYDKIRIDESLDRLLDRVYKEMFDAFYGKCRKLLDERYRSIPFPFDEIESPLLESVHFWNLKKLEGFFHSWSPVQKYKTETGTDPVPDFMAQIENLWGNAERRKVVFPTFLRLGRIYL